MNLFGRRGGRGREGGTEGREEGGDLDLAYVHSQMNPQA